TLQKRIDKQRRRLAKRAATSSAVPVPRQGGIPKPVIWAGLLIAVIAVGLVVWVLIPETPAYDQQIASGRSFLEQTQFENAREILQQVPSSSPLYAQAQSLINQVQDAEKKSRIDTLVTGHQICDSRAKTRRAWRPLNRY